MEIARKRKLANPFGDLYFNRRVLVTGHTGFKGAWLSYWLWRLGAQVSGIALPPSTNPSLFSLLGLDHKIDNHLFDISSQAKVEKAIQRIRPEMVFHLAAQPIVRQSYEQPDSTFHVNVSGLVNLLTALKKCPSVKVIVIVTSDKCYENNGWTRGYQETDRLGGDDPYSASKACAEIVTHSYSKSFFRAQGVSLVSARAGNVIGGGDWADYRIIPDIVRAIGRKKNVALRNPIHIRPWLHVLEASYGYLLLNAYCLGQQEATFGAWNFGPNENDCATVEKLSGEFLTEIRARDCSIRRDTLLEPVDEKPILKLSHKKAARTLGWLPQLNFEGRVRQTANWYREYISGQKSAENLCTQEIEAFTEKIPPTSEFFNIVPPIRSKTSAKMEV